MVEYQQHYESACKQHFEHSILSPSHVTAKDIMNSNTNYKFSKKIMTEKSHIYIFCYRNLALMFWWRSRHLPWLMAFAQHFKQHSIILQGVAIKQLISLVGYIANLY